MVDAVSRTVLAAGLAGVLLAGCGSGRNGDDMREVNQADASELVEGYGRQVFGAVHAPAQGLDPIPNPCDGSFGEVSGTVYSMVGHGQIPVPAAEQVGTLARLRDHWQRHGYSVEEDRVFPDGRTGTVAVRNPVDGVRIRVTSTEPPTMFALMISTPCYRSDEPL
ncbi:hypothetical protein O7626_35905 [Micromonospora sp. WMMD1102]|uniref:hypothetical protein n=1 Tax=Micromonospora sp. WMMD1102 TaxID=3016105 RepID=UPI002415299A|nr:hypothetical protein [Micromonospora sp. WMMD1102]MDG4791223.1 hypothetical protein [Micromonospora sp. WMMD1102]